jgi:hypothetical protein
LPLYDYGLAVKPFLDKGITRSFKRSYTVAPTTSASFYVVTLSDHGVGSTLRTGLSIAGRELTYTINNKKIKCGEIDAPDLSLQQE